MWCLNKLFTKRIFDREISTSNTNNYKVSVIGGAGQIGQALILLLKLNPLVKELHVNDVVEHTAGVVEDASHICTATQMKGFVGEEQLEECLEGADVVVVSAGISRAPGMSREDLFDKNAELVARIACKVATACPCALLAFITNPINSIVPLAAEVLKANDVFNPQRLFGITTLDVVRARKFIADFMCVNPKKVNIPVIGGHSAVTILPLFSQCKPKFKGRREDLCKLTKRIQEAGDEVVKLKAGNGCASLSMGFAGAHFVNALLRGLNNERNVIECSYVASECPELPFFATPIVLGPNGIKKNLGLPKMNKCEKCAMKKLIPELKKDIEKGVKFVKPC